MREFLYTVPDSELERIYHHLNHARALTYLEKARLDFMKEMGFASDKLIADGIFPVIARIDVMYKREIFGGPITVTCEEGRIEGKSMVLTQRIFNQKGKEVLLALVESKFMNGTTKRAGHVPAGLRLKFREVFGAESDPHGE